MDEKLSEIHQKVVSCTNTLFESNKEQDQLLEAIPRGFERSLADLQKNLSKISVQPPLVREHAQDTRKASSEVFPRGVHKDMAPHYKAPSPRPDTTQKREETILRDDEGEYPSNQHPYNLDVGKVPGHGDKSSFPKTSEYPTFEGKPDEDWVYFLEIIDSLKHAYNLPDSEITARLPNILRGVARVWYRVTCTSHRGGSWEEWKALIKAKFNTSAWRVKQLTQLEKERFSYSNQDVLEFLLTLHRRIMSCYPGTGMKDQISHMLMRLPSGLEATIQMSSKDVKDISEFISICEEIIVNSWGMKNAFRYNSSSNEKTPEAPQGRRPFEKKKPIVVPLVGSSNDRKPKGGKPCFKCKGPWSAGHVCKPNHINLVSKGKKSNKSSSPPSDDDLN